MSDVGGFEGKILCEVSQPCAPREKSDILPGSKWKCRRYGFTVTVIGLRPDREISYLADDGKTYSSPRHVWRELYEPWPQPEPETTSEQLAEIEGQAEDTPVTGYTPPEGWRVLAVGEVLRDGDMWVNHEGESRPTKRAGEKVHDERYIRPIEPEPQPEPQPQPQPQPEHLQAIIAAQAETIARLQSEAHELNMEIGGLQRRLSERQARIRDLETMHAAATQAVVDAGKENDKLRAQADDFRSEIHYVQKELGEARAELAGAIQSRDALAAVNREIRRNETLREQLDAAATELQKRHPDHVGRAISTDEWMDQFARDASVSRLQADRNDLAGKVISLREQLQQANDRLAFLETLQPIAAACHTAQTMVRDMLGHLRCLLALQHTTDRRDSCTLLESILEVFDDAECDEDENDDTTCTTNTSEAKQG